MPLSLTCSCGAYLEVDDKFAGQTIHCPDCQKALQVPRLERTVVRTSGLALGSLILALVGAFTVLGPLVAAGLGLLALRQIRQHPDEVAGRGFALSGVVLGGVFTLVGVLAYVASDRIDLEALLTRRRLAGKVEFPEELEVRRHREGFALTRPSDKWGVLREPNDSNAPVQPQDELKFVNAARDAEILCRPDYVPGHWSLEESSAHVVRNFKDLFGSTGYTIRSSQRLPSPNDAEMLEMVLDRSQIGGSRTYLVRLIRRKARDRGDDRQVQVYLVGGGTRKSRFKRIEPDVKKALESFQLLER
jgi:hypothetical protein